MKRFAIQKQLFKLLLLVGILAWVLVKLSTTCFFKANLGEKFQNTHIVLFKSHRDVMQISTLSAQLGVGLALVDWYRNTTSVPYGHLLIDLSPRTHNRLRNCTNTGSIPSKFYLPDRLKQSKILGDKNTKSLYSTSVPITFPQMQMSFPSVLPKKVVPGFFANAY